jgi:hypothetical protein
MKRITVGRLRRDATLASITLLLLGGLWAGSPAEARGSDSHAARGQELTVGLDFAEAHKELAKGNPDDPNIVIESGRLALYEADCDLALVLLARPDIARTDEGAALGDIARGCSRVTAATVIDKDDAHAVEVRYQDESDRALTPLVVATVTAARDALTRDLGVTWPRPTRITVVRDIMSLSAMTGLPLKDAQTTGTVAVAKWGRVTLLSPRASQHGYTWRDTIAHELTHLALTRATIDHAPLWLQEGVAKREEVRWRDLGPFDDRPSPDTIVNRGMELKLDLPLDKLGPSIAMLPSADAAMVAFAEVTSFVRFMANESKVDVLPKLLAAMREGATPEAALHDVTGLGLKEWDTRWRGYLAEKPKESLPAVFGLGSSPKAGAKADLRELSARARLAELLLGRDHPTEALAQIDRVGTSQALEDPSLRYLKARVLEALGRTEEGAPLVADPNDVVSSFGPWWAVRGRWARARGDDSLAGSSFVEAIATDPLEVEAACEGLKPDGPEGPKNPLSLPLCDAARARQEPDLGRE